MELLAKNDVSAPTVIDLDTRRRRLATGVKWALAIAAAAVIAPITYLAVKGIVGLALAAIAGLAVVNLAPVVSMKFANWKLRALKAEAAANPIETLQNQQIEMERNLAKQADKITEFDEAVETYRDQLRAEAEEQPAAAAAGIPTLRQMERLLQFRRLKFKRAQEDIKARRKNVEQAQSRFRVALAAQAVTKAAGETEGTVLNKILEDIAFTSVDATVNKSMAALRTAVMVDDLPAEDVDLKRLAHQTPLTIDAPSITTAQILEVLKPAEPPVQAQRGAAS